MPVVIDSFEVLPAGDMPAGDSKSDGKESKNSDESPHEQMEHLARLMAERAARVRAH